MLLRVLERSVGVGQEVEGEGELGRVFVVVFEGGVGLGFVSLNCFRRYWSRGFVFIVWGLVLRLLGQVDNGQSLRV